MGRNQTNEHIFLKPSNHKSTSKIEMESRGHLLDKVCQIEPFIRTRAFLNNNFTYLQQIQESLTYGSTTQERYSSFQLI